MAWTEAFYPQPYDPHVLQIFPAPQQPTTTILQQLPAAIMPPGSAPSIRPGGHVKEDLVEMMMIQNAQMHQVIMSNMTVSALRSFGYVSPPSGPVTPRDLHLIQESETDPEIFHHYYQPAPHLSYPAWLLPQATLIYQNPNKPTTAALRNDRPDVPLPPPPPPLITTGTISADVTPAAENNSAEEER
ncbi:proline-rich protein 29-like [Sphaeramia orbicularis]|uniref:proline-rich protein 29-like n=1 Tax=Sphaeramia orbicularis TaxID=375764 RepID=UPI00118026CF|nr:proline-rich protein 29 [Sphaeramia orbicularis]